MVAGNLAENMRCHQCSHYYWNLAHCSFGHIDQAGVPIDRSCHYLAVHSNDLVGVVASEAPNCDNCCCNFVPEVAPAYDCSADHALVVPEHFADILAFDLVELIDHIVHVLTRFDPLAVRVWWVLQKYTKRKQILLSRHFSYSSILFDRFFFFWNSINLRSGMHDSSFHYFSLISTFRNSFLFWETRKCELTLLQHSALRLIVRCNWNRSWSLRLHKTATTSWRTTASKHWLIVWIVVRRHVVTGDIYVRIVIASSAHRSISSTTRRINWSSYGRWRRRLICWRWICLWIWVRCHRRCLRFWWHTLIWFRRIVIVWDRRLRQLWWRRLILNDIVIVLIRHGTASWWHSAGWSTTESKRKTKWKKLWLKKRKKKDNNDYSLTEIPFRAVPLVCRASAVHWSPLVPFAACHVLCKIDFFILNNCQNAIKSFFFLFLPATKIESSTWWTFNWTQRKTQKTIFNFTISHASSIAYSFFGRLSIFRLTSASAKISSHHWFAVCTVFHTTKPTAKFNLFFASLETNCSPFWFSFTFHTEYTLAVVTNTQN